MKKISFKEFLEGNALISNKHRRLLSLIRENKIVSLLVMFVLLGVIFGSVSARFADENMLLNMDFLFASNFKARTHQSFLDVFLSSLTSSFVFVLFLFLMGSSIWGFIFIPGVPFFRGFGMGIAAGYLYMTYGLKGVLFHFAVLLPGAFISMLGIIISSKSSMDFSSKLASKIMPNSNYDKLWPDLKDYITKIGYVFIILVISSIADVALAFAIGNKFVF